MIYFYLNCKIAWGLTKHKAGVLFGAANLPRINSISDDYHVAALNHG
jgi:hypothetical protein